MEHAYAVGAATTSDDFERLWQASGVPGATRNVDFSRDIAVSFSQGVGSSCPDLTLDDVVIDSPTYTVWSVVSNPLGNVPCTADLAGSVVFVVAIPRAALPSSLITVQLDPPGQCAGLTCTSIQVNLNPPPSSVTPSPLPAPAEGFTRFPGHNFSFDYPSDWNYLSGFSIHGPDGPRFLAAVGIGEFDNGCRDIPGGESCGPPTRTVPKNGIVLDYRIAPNIGGGSFPSPRPGEEWVSVGGRQARVTRSENLVTWWLPPLPEYIEIEWGPAMADQATEIIQQVIASWHWDQPAYQIQ